jgi:hypothetical protein
LRHRRLADQLAYGRLDEVRLASDLQNPGPAEPLDPAVHLEPDVIPHMSRGIGRRLNNPVPGAGTQAGQVHAGDTADPGPA